MTNYRAIDDSGPVVVDPNVTCLIGKNESGKSAVMQALWKFNNVAGATFDLLTDLPAERFIELRKEDPEVLILHFLLEEADEIEFCESFGPLVATPDVVTIRSTFSGKRSVEIPLVATIEEQIRNWVLDRLPTFIYFEDYGRLRTRINLSTYLSRNRKPPSGEDGALHRTQQALFEWTKLDPQELHALGLPMKSDETQEQVERRKAERSRLLESASYRASGAWIEWWDPRTNIHTLVIEADGDDLELRVSDDINPWKIPFGDRARGFQWFFSFYLTFLMESAKAHRGAILLLDEPGLHLHLTQQLKLLAFFQTVAKHNQVIYSSHSPFMVDPDRPGNVRTVYLRSKNPDDPKSRAYTRVSGGTEPEGDRETLLPMQAAWAYQLAQTIFLGKRTLIVEGMSDYWLLRTLSSWQKDKGARYLNEDTVLVWAGGMTYMLPLASIMASREQMGPNRMAVLLDGDKGGLNKVRELVRVLTAEGGSAGNVLLLGDILKIQGAEIEDVVESGELVAALRAAGRTFATTPTRQLGETNVPFLRRVYAENGWGELTVQEKARIVLALADSWRSRGTSPQSATLARASDVFTAINECFDRLFAAPR